MEFLAYTGGAGLIIGLVVRGAFFRSGFTFQRDWIFAATGCFLGILLTFATAGLFL